MIAALVLGGIALASWLGKASYAPLFTGLAAADASSITDQLQTDGVPYQLTDGGATILVPQAQVYSERLKAASNGLPSSNEGGYSLLDKMGVTSSEFQQDVTYKRAMEGELAKTIGAMDGVQTATVQLAIPEKSVFVSEEKDPTASVFIATENGTQLSTDQVQAIVHLTSASVEGMQTTDVSVVDAKGQTLSAVGTGATGSGADQAADYDAATSKKIQDLLDTTLGVGNATVVVSGTMNQESGTRTSESYTTPDLRPGRAQRVEHHRGVRRRLRCGDGCDRGPRPGQHRRPERHRDERHGRRRVQERVGDEEQRRRPHHRDHADPLGGPSTGRPSRSR